MADRAKPRTIMYFRVLIEDEASKRTVPTMTAAKWDTGLANQRKKSLLGRTHEVDGERLIGRPFTVEGDPAMSLMTPRDEESWLAIVKQDAQSIDDEKSDYAAEENSELVETSVLAFVPGTNNIFGLVRGSATAPTHKDVANWFTKAFKPGNGKFYVAVPCTTKEMRKRLKTADGSASTTVRLPLSKAENLTLGGVNLGEALATMRQKRGEMIVTITLSVPPGTSKQHQDARKLLQEDTELLLEYPGVDMLKANLAVSDMERRRREEVNLIEQRLTAKSAMQTRNEKGEVIREDSAVRAIRARAADEGMAAALAKADEK